MDAVRDFVAVGGTLGEEQEMFSDLHEMCFIQWPQTLRRWVRLVFEGLVALLDIKSRQLGG